MPFVFCVSLGHTHTETQTRCAIWLMNVVAIAAATFVVGMNEWVKCMFVNLSICIATTRNKSVYVASRCPIICYWHVYCTYDCICIKFTVFQCWFERPVQQRQRNTRSYIFRAVLHTCYMKLLIHQTWNSAQQKTKFIAM